MGTPMLESPLLALGSVLIQRFRKLQLDQGETGAWTIILLDPQQVLVVSRTGFEHEPLVQIYMGCVVVI